MRKNYLFSLLTAKVAGKLLCLDKCCSFELWYAMLTVRLDLDLGCHHVHKSSVNSFPIQSKLLMLAKVIIPVTNRLKYFLATYYGMCVNST